MSSYILADDLSGALEAGAAFRVAGKRIVLSLKDSPAASAETLQVVSSETRNATAPEARRAVGHLLLAQQAAGRQLLFKKIDSTLRGPVGAEIKALVEALAPPLVVICPANPAMGRTVSHGRLFVNGLPVDQTAFRRDPRWPVSESRVASVVAAGGVGRVVTLSLTDLRRMEDLGADRAQGVLVSDAETVDDLHRLVRMVSRIEPGAVYVGSGGLAHALAGGGPPPGKGNWDLPRRVLIVNGSKSERSREQLECLRAQHGVPMHEIRHSGSERDDAVAAAIADSFSQRGAASLTMARDFPASDPISPVRRLTDIVAGLSAAGAEPDLLAATGGETARALCDALRIDHLELLGEIEPGVVVAAVPARAGRKLASVVIKPGGFGSESVWAAVIRPSHP